jgi:P27 family predicted phage terminase small subunit
MKKSTKPKPPNDLSDEAKRWWKLIIEDFEVDDQPGLLLLGTALESFDRMRQAQAAIKKDGVCIEDRFGKPRQHPATLVERDAKNMMLRALKQMNLDIQPGSPLSSRMR